MTYIHQAWPSWRFGPNGEALIFERAEDVPEGWSDTPPPTPAPARGNLTEGAPDALKAARADADRASDLVAKFQAERDKLVEGLTELGFSPKDDGSPVDTALDAIRGLLGRSQSIATEADAAPGGTAAPAGAPDDIKALRAQYEAATGRKPFMGWDADELRRRMAR